MRLPRATLARLPAGPEPTERQFQAQLVALAKLNGWRCYHTHDSRRSDPGFPDLVLVRERVIFAELKRRSGKLRLEQREWLHDLENAGAEVYLLRPDDWADIERLLERRAA